MSITRFLASAESRTRESGFAVRVITDLLDASHRVRFTDMIELHRRVRQFGFVLDIKQRFPRGGYGMLPGNIQLLYIRGHLLLRVKTLGTYMRPRPHLTLSHSVGGTTFADETMKFSVRGGVPKLPGVVRAARDHRVLNRVITAHRADWGEGIMAGLVGLDDEWANSCHFDFVDGFDGSGAETLAARHEEVIRP